MISQTVPSKSLLFPPRLGGRVQSYDWQWQGQSLTAAYETLGEGQPVLLLPALSTVSTRAEMGELATNLASQFQVWALDWPGFGDSSRLRLEYRPELYQQFLKDFVQSVFETAVRVVAAGHAAGYVMQLAARTPAIWSKVVLVAPTWRGPLPVMGAPSVVRNGVRALVRSPVVGQALYGLNTQPAFLKWMYRRHVFVDETKLTPHYIEQRYQGTQKSGARYAPAAFVTGSLDPATTRDEFLTLFERRSVPLMIVVADRAPASSKAEMEAIAALPDVQAASLPGTLGMAEEYGNAVAETITPFL